MGDSHENKEDEMADFKLSDGIKTFFLAGVGAVALTAEKSQEIIGELVKKGELTVEQGKELNKDLQRSFKETMDKKGVNIDELGQKISKMSADELAKIKEQIAAAEKIVSERLNAAGEDAEEAAEDAKESAEEINYEGVSIPTNTPQIFEDVDPIPPEEECDFCIVSAMYVAACKSLGINTKRLLTIGAPVVDEENRVIGTCSLNRN